MSHKQPIEFARQLRQTGTSSERLLWQLLRDRQRCGKKFRRQHPLGSYTVDFYCAEAKLVVEVDGSVHATDEGKRKDQVRDAWLRGQGIEVLRFGGFEVEEETRQVLERIDEVLKQRCGIAPSSPALLPRSTGGEGS
jgi:very-short-patch-repair endonuclease